MAITNLSQDTTVTFSAKDNNVELTSGLSSTPAGFTTATAVTVDVTYSMTGYNNDTWVDLDVWIETAGATLLASNSGSWLKVDSRTSDTGSTTSGTLTFNTINTTADKTDWDGAVIRYRQTLDANMGADSVWYETTAADVEITYVDPPDDLLADNIQSGSEVSKPAIAQVHALTADSIQSGSEVSSPAIAQEHALTATSVQSGSQVSSPVLAEVTQNDLLADNIQSGSETSNPAIGQIHALTADDIQSGSEVSSPAIGQDHQLTATSIQSGSETSQPTAAEGNHSLFADSIQSGSEVSAPAIGQAHVFTATSVQSGSQVSQPILGSNVEKLIPDADTSIGNWTTHTGSTGSLFQQIDEDVPNDSDYIRSELSPQDSPSRFKLSDPAAAIDVGDAQWVKYRYAKDVADSEQIDLTVRLIQGASTLIVEWKHFDIPVTVVEAGQLLTASQKTAITDHDDLFIEFSASTPITRLVQFTGGDEVRFTGYPSTQVEFN